MSFPLPTFGDADDLLFRLTQGRSGTSRQVVFLVGSALTAPREPGSPGVPRVAGVVELIRDELASSPDALNKLDEQLAANPSDSYQRAFGFLQNRLGQDRANQVVRKAVLRARIASETNQRALEGEPSACQALEKDLQGWALNPALESLGRIFTSPPDTFGQMVLTSNFDPLIGIAIRNAGGQAYRTVLHGDGSLGQTVADGCQVVHFHGYWHGADTLHTTAQLGHARPQLEASLAELLRHQAMLVAVGYGGWDDVLTSTLMRVVLEAHAYPEVLWTFYEKQETRIEQRYARLLEGLRPGLGRGRVTLFQGIDAHEFFPRLASALGIVKSVQEEGSKKDSATRQVSPRVSLNPLAWESDSSSTDHRIYTYTDVNDDSDAEPVRMLLEVTASHAVILTALTTRASHEQVYTTKPEPYVRLDQTDFVPVKLFFHKDSTGDTLMVDGERVASLPVLNESQLKSQAADFQVILNALKFSDSVLVEYWSLLFGKEREVSFSLAGFAKSYDSLIQRTARDPISLIGLLLEGNRFSVSTRDLRVKNNPHGAGVFVYVPETRYFGVERKFIWFVRSGTAVKLNGPTHNLTPSLQFPQDASMSFWEGTSLSRDNITRIGLKLTFGFLEQLVDRSALKQEGEGPYQQEEGARVWSGGRP